MDEQQVPRVVIVVEAGVVKRVMSDTVVKFVVLDDDLLSSEDVVGIVPLVKSLPKYELAELMGELALDNHRKRFKEEAQRRLRMLTE